MKILHLSTFNHGGAAMIPRMAHEECLRNGYTSAWIVRGGALDDQMHVKVLNESLWLELERYLERVRATFCSELQTDSKYCFFNPNERRFFNPAREILNTCEFKPDLICIYWSSGFINTATIRSLWNRTGATIRIFLTDMAFYTGGCHYSMECEGYQKDCQICPAILSKHPRRAYKNLSTKIKNLKGLPLEIISSRGQSFEMANKASLLKPFDIVPTVCWVTSKAASMSKAVARQKLEIQEDRIILLMGSMYLHEPRKGFSILIQALEAISRNDSIDTSKLEIALIGKGLNKLSDRIPFPTRFLGYLNFERKLPLAFTASDCFISSSIADAGPYMINLSIYNNCPVIAFPVGVAKYLVGEKKAGIMANDITADCLSEAILEFLSLCELERIELSNQCKKVAKSDLSWNQDLLKQLFKA